VYTIHRAQASCNSTTDFNNILWLGLKGSDFQRITQALELREIRKDALRVAASAASWPSRQANRENRNRVEKAVDGPKSLFAL
jgi:hypothetical protein